MSINTSSPDREPRTEAGRRLLDGQSHRSEAGRPFSTQLYQQWLAVILAIESEAAHEARTAALDPAMLDKALRKFGGGGGWNAAKVAAEYDRLRDLEQEEPTRAPDRATEYDETDRLLRSTGVDRDELREALTGALRRRWTMWADDEAEDATPLATALVSDPVVRAVLSGVNLAGPIPGGFDVVTTGDVLTRAALAATRDEPGLREAVAEAIYDAMREQDPEGREKPWVPRGNSHKQNEARRRADAALSHSEVRSALPPTVIDQKRWSEEEPYRAGWSDGLKSGRRSALPPSDGPDVIEDALDSHRQGTSSTCLCGQWTPYGEAGTTFRWHVARAIAAAIDARVSS